jgi:hypothetical protein
VQVGSRRSMLLCRRSRTAPGVHEVMKIDFSNFVWLRTHENLQRHIANRYFEPLKNVDEKHLRSIHAGGEPRHARAHDRARSGPKASWSLVRELVKVKSPTPADKLSVLEQQSPGEAGEPPEFDEAQRRGIPDGWIFDDEQGRCVFLECKVISAQAQADCRTPRIPEHHGGRDYPDSRCGIAGR